MVEHVEPEALDEFVRTAQPLSEEQLLHLQDCALCAAALREAAHDGERYRLLASAPARRRAPARRLWASAALAAVGAIAAAALLWIRAAPPKALVLPDCASNPDTARCLERAAFDGLMAVGPGNTVVFPRYAQEVAR
jgi:ferric-dicitrate binding protein FerR (iron transport regulator)